MSAELVAAKPPEVEPPPGADRYPPVGRLLRQSAFAISAAARDVAATGRDVIHLELGEPDLPSPPHAVGALVAAAREGWTRYTPPAGDPQVRELLASHYQASLGMQLTGRQLLLVPGSNMVLHLTLLALAADRDEVLVPDPGYPVYAELVRLAGAVPIPYRLRPELCFVPDPAELSALIGPRTRLLILNFPHNPTGAVLSRAAAEAIVTVSHAGDFYILRDQAYHRLNWTDPDGEADAVLAALPPTRTIVMDTLSKSHAMCGWRASVAVVPPALADDMAVLATNTNCAMPTFVQRAMLAALLSPAAAGWARQYAAEFRHRRDLTIQALAELPGTTVSTAAGGFYVFPDIRATGLSDTALAHRLLTEAGVAVAPGSLYGPGGRGHIRIAYTQPAERLLAAFARIRLVVEELS